MQEPSRNKIMASDECLLEGERTKQQMNLKEDPKNLKYEKKHGFTFTTWIGSSWYIYEKQSMITAHVIWDRTSEVLNMLP